MVPPVTAPIFFGVGKGDVVCTPKIGKMAFTNPLFKDRSIVIKEYEGDHWLIISDGEEIARDLNDWILSAVIPATKV